jgi:hypothetical protein
LAYLILSLGALMLLGGSAATILGLPYIVLESGFTQVIIGVVIATGGLIVMVGGAILREIKVALIRLGHAAVQAPMPQDKVEAAEAAAASPPTASSSPSPALAIGLAGAAGAILAAGTAGISGGDLALANDAAAGDAETKADTLEEPETGIPDPENTSPDQGSLPLPGGGIVESEEPDRAEGVLEETETSTGADTASTIAQDEDHPNMKPAEERLADAYDDLRQSLTLPLPQGAIQAGPAPGESKNAPGSLGREDDADDEPLPAAMDAPAKPLIPALPSSIVPAGPVSSQEGVVSVRQIGESTYTMFADGTVRAMTPDGEKEYASIADLKADLALRL